MATSIVWLQSWMRTWGWKQSVKHDWEESQVRSFTWIAPLPGLYSNYSEPLGIKVYYQLINGYYICTQHDSNNYYAQKCLFTCFKRLAIKHIPLKTRKWYVYTSYYVHWVNSQCTSSEHSPCVAQLSTHRVSPLLTETFVTDCTPLAILVDLYTPVRMYGGVR